MLETHAFAERPNPAPGRPFNAAYDRLIRQMPPDVLQTFSEGQLSALERGLRASTPRHQIDFRVSIPWIGGRFYIAIFGGRENRSLERLRREGQFSPGRVAGTYGVILTIVATLMILSAVVLAYSLDKIFEDPMRQSFGWTRARR